VREFWHGFSVGGIIGTLVRIAVGGIIRTLVRIAVDGEEQHD
jgi:hypothetical protein